MAVETHVLDRVRELRACGYSPKQIAKTLDLRPAVAARLVRMLAAEDTAAAPEPARRGRALVSVDRPCQRSAALASRKGNAGRAPMERPLNSFARFTEACGLFVVVFFAYVRMVLFR